MVKLPRAHWVIPVASWWNRRLCIASLPEFSTKAPASNPKGARAQPSICAPCRGAAIEGNRKVESAKALQQQFESHAHSVRVVFDECALAGVGKWHRKMHGLHLLASRSYIMGIGTRAQPSQRSNESVSVQRDRFGRRQFQSTFAMDGACLGTVIPLFCRNW